MKVKVGISNRHCHLEESVFNLLFGNDYKPEILKELTQPGEFAYKECVIIKTPKSSIENVRILGPFRSYSQIEITKTDAYKLGLKPPVRNSGDIEASESITLIGPKGEVDLDKGVIIAARHLHINDDQLAELGLQNGQIISVKVDNEKGGILNNVHVKSSPNYAYELHLDTDDANANLIMPNEEVEIIK